MALVKEAFNHLLAMGLTQSIELQVDGIKSFNLL